MKGAPARLKTEPQAPSPPRPSPSASGKVLFEAGIDDATLRWVCAYLRCYPRQTADWASDSLAAMASRVARERNKRLRIMEALDGGDDD